METALGKIAYAIELMPAEPGYRLLQANLQQTLLRLDAAKAGYTAVLQLDPTNAVARESLALCDQLTLSTNGGGWEAKSLTNLLATLRRQQRLDEARYLTSQGGAGDKQLVQTWQARLAAAGVKPDKLYVQGDQKLALYTNGLTDQDMAVLKGMPLSKFWTSRGKAIRSLAPLAGIPLEELYIDKADMDSLEPLRGMPLRNFTLRFSRVSDLRPLVGMPLTNLVVYHCPNVKDISPLSGMPLQRLQLSATPVENLTPLYGMRLVDLIGVDASTNLAPLAGMPFQHLSVNVLRVPDLKPLAGLPLRRLNLLGADYVKLDLSPLRECPQLEELEIAINATDWQVLLEIPSLKTVTRSSPRKPMPPAQFIAEQIRPAKK